MNVKQNLKYQSTHKAIINALLELLEEKSIEHVTVAEICRRVHINRTTFYLHFDDIPAALEEIQRQVNGRFVQTFPGHKPGKEDFLRLFEHVRQNKGFYAAILSQGNRVSMQSLLFPAEAPTPDMAGLPVTDRTIEDEYEGEMFYAALTALVRRWLKRGCAESPEHMCEILQRLFPDI